MDTSKVIELGSVSEETKGHRGLMENTAEPTTGIFDG